MSLSLWRDISVVWLSVLCLIGFLIPLGISYLAVVAMHKVLNIVPRYFARAQKMSGKVRVKTSSISQHAAEPVVQAETWMARVQTSWQALWGSKSRPASFTEKGIINADQG